MNHEKILVIFEEITGLKQQLESAIHSANELRNLNADSHNVTAIIERFEMLEQLTDEKITQIKTTSQLFKRHSYLSVIAALLIAIISGGAAGYIGVHKELTAYIKHDILKKETQEIVDARLDIATEKAALINYLIFERTRAQGVQYFNNAMILPVAINKLTEDKDKAVYLFD